MIKFKQKRGIKSQLFTAQISLVLISTISFFILSSAYLYNQNINDVHRNIEHAGDLSASSVNRIFAQLENTVYYVSVNTEIPTILSSTEKSNIIIQQRNRTIINNTWTVMQSAHTYPIDFTIYASPDNQNIFFDDNSFQTINKIESENWYNTLMQSKNRMIYFLEDDKFFIASKLYTTDNYNRSVGILRVALNVSVLKNTLNTDATGNCFGIILDSNNNIIAPSENLPMSKNDINKIKQIKHGASPNSILFDNGNRYFIVSHKLDNQNFRLFTMHNVSSIYQEISVMLILLILILLPVSAFAFLIAWHRSLPLVNVFNTLSNAIKGMNLGDFKTLDIPSDMDDNIIETYNDYNQLTQTITNLIQYNSDYETNIKKLELDFLQQQIKPHFLYNTLNTIQGLVKGNDLEKVLELINSLSKFYHLSLHNSDSCVDLLTEIKHITHYVKIENFKFNDVITLNIDLPADILQCKVPKLILQPLIENAVHHGIREKENGKGEITISHKREGEDIYLYIIDDGVGISPEKIDEIKQGHSIGYINTDRRLRLFFGEEYGLDIESVKSQFTKIIIKIKDGNLNDKNSDC